MGRSLGGGAAGGRTTHEGVVHRPLAVHDGLALFDGHNDRLAGVISILPPQLLADVYVGAGELAHDQVVRWGPGSVNPF